MPSLTESSDDEQYLFQMRDACGTGSGICALREDCSLVHVTGDLASADRGGRDVIARRRLRDGVSYLILVSRIDGIEYK